MRRNPPAFLFLLLRLALLVALTVVFLPPVAAARLGGASAAHRVGRAWCRLVLLVFGIGLRVAGRDLVERGPVLFVANHLSYLDIPALVVALPRPFRFMALAGLFRIPLIGQAMRLCGYVPVPQRRPKAVRAALDKAAGLLRAGVPVLIFCEGGINRTADKATLSAVERGFFRLATETGVAIQPLTLHGTDAAQERLTRLGHQAAVAIRPAFQLYIADTFDAVAARLTTENRAAYLELEQAAAGRAGG